MMRLWSIQDESVMPRLLKNGYIEGDINHIDKDDYSSYLWLMNAMADQGVEVRGSSPMWSWYAYGGGDAPAPKLNDRWLLPKGSRGVCIEFQAPESSVVLTQFDMWTRVMDHSPVILDESESDMDSNWSLEDIQKTWFRIFDLNAGDEEIWGPVKSRAIQAVLGEIRLDWVIDTAFFHAK